MRQFIGFDDARAMASLRPEKSEAATTIQNLTFSARRCRLHQALADAGFRVVTRDGWQHVIRPITEKTQE